MKADQMNMALQMEIIGYRETDNLTMDLKILLMELIWLEMAKDRYKFITDNIKILCEAEAYIECCKHCIHYNPEKSDNARAYVIQIIGCAFAKTIKTNAAELGLKKTITKIKV